MGTSTSANHPRPVLLRRPSFQTSLATQAESKHSGCFDDGRRLSSTALRSRYPMNVSPKNPTPTREETVSQPDTNPDSRNEPLQFKLWLSRESRSQRSSVPSSVFPCALCGDRFFGWLETWTSGRVRRPPYHLLLDESGRSSSSSAFLERADRSASQCLLGVPLYPLW